jgi:Tfp pilus assembly protein PilO
MRSSFLIAIVLIAASFAVFFGFTEPTFQVTRALEERNARLDEALTRASDLQALRNELISRFNLMEDEDIRRLELFLPDSIDTVRLVLDVDTRARLNGIRVDSYTLKTGDTTPTRPDQPAAVYGTIELSMVIDGRYDDMIKLLADLEKSLRLMDVVRLEVTQDAAEGTARNRVHKYEITVRSYWLR